MGNDYGKITLCQDLEFWREQIRGCEPIRGHEMCATCALGFDDQESDEACKVACKLGSAGNPSGGGCWQPRRGNENA